MKASELTLNALIKLQEVCAQNNITIHGDGLVILVNSNITQRQEFPLITKHTLEHKIKHLTESP